MTDRAMIARARAHLGVRAPVHVRRMSAFADPGLIGEYMGRDAAGAHLIHIAADVRGVARLYTIAHECAHAAQAEAFDGHEAFARAYSAHGAWQQVEFKEYRANPFEVDARERGRRVVASVTGADRSSRNARIRARADA